MFAGRDPDTIAFARNLAGAVVAVLTAGSVVVSAATVAPLGLKLGFAAVAFVGALVAVALHVAERKARARNTGRVDAGFDDCEGVRLPMVVVLPSESEVCFSTSYV